MQLMTIGYEGMSIDAFFDVLNQNRVEVLVDIRELPISRKRGFSKTALSESSTRHNLGYMHLHALGSPREVRHDYRADKDWARYTTRFSQYLDTQAQAVHDLATLITRKRCCLLCFEADAACCHRSYVAQRVATFSNIPINITHLQAIAPLPVARPRLAIA